MSLSNSQNKTAKWHTLNYCVLDNLEDYVLLFPHIPGIANIKVRENRRSGNQKPGYSIFLETEVGVGVIEDIPENGCEALLSRGLLLVGIDALSRPVFEKRVKAGSQINLTVIKG